MKRKSYRPIFAALVFAASTLMCADAEQPPATQSKDAASAQTQKQPAAAQQQKAPGNESGKLVGPKRPDQNTAPTDTTAPVQASTQDPAVTDPAMAGAMQQYEAIVQSGGWPVIPDGDPLKKGDRGERVAVVRTRLAKSGDLEASLDNGSQEFDEALSQAVIAFQERHGEEGDGIVGGETLAAMNIPAEQRLEQLRLNVQRRAELPPIPSGRAVFVNIPDFTLVATENGKAVLNMKVVVGDEMGQTPTFADEIETIVFHPFWNVPTKITREEIAEKVRKDPNYLAKKHMEVVKGESDKAQILDPASINWANLPEKMPFRLRQRPGSDNALGRVKFLFPNKYNVYLHDTPEQARFDDNERNDSHGCIRVEKPLELAQFLLKGEPKWDNDAVAAAMQGNEQKTVSLSHKVPVNIFYWTAWVRNGKVQFREDFYEKDGVAPEHVESTESKSSETSGAKTSGGA